MSDHYVQTVEVAIDSKSRKLKVVGMAFLLLAFVFVPLTAFISLYCLIGFFLLLAAGIAFTQIFNNSAKEFEYDFNALRLVISKTNVIARRHRYLELLFSDVFDFDLFADTVLYNDMIACGDTQAQDVRYLVFSLNGESKRLIFAPDDYMTALIEQKVTIKKNKLGE